jgi:hypothetical protein
VKICSKALETLKHAFEYIPDKEQAQEDFNRLDPN